MGIDPASGAPDTYEDLWVHYRRFVVKQVIRGGIPLQDADDVADEIICRFMERGMLETYDPNRLHDISALPGRPTRALNPGERLRPARFSSYLRRFVFLNMLSQRDRVRARARREHLVIDDLETPWEAEDSRSNRTTAIEQGIDARAVFTRAAPRISAIASPTGRWDMESALEACRESVELTGRVSRKLVGERLGISATAVGSILVRMRAELSAAGADEVLGTSDTSPRRARGA